MAVAAVSLFILSGVVANLIVAAFGQPALVVTAWFLIPMEMLTRDVLHERWKADRLWTRQVVMIASGGFLTAFVSWDAWRVAVASFVAFSASGLTNALGYHLLQHRPRWTRMNGSNAGAAAIDSLLFPVVAFGWHDTSLALCAAQAASKFTGGLVWSAAYLYIAKRASR